jgi:hypothetical protein
MAIAPTFQRTPLVISAGTLVAGPVNAAFREGDPSSLLHSYLVLVRQLRGQQRASTITLRREDVEALAVHLGSSEERVLDDLLDRMGASRAQRRAFGAMFALGALTIVATGSVALDIAPSTASADGRVGSTVAVEVTPPAASPAIDMPTSTIVPLEPVVASVALPDPQLAIAGAGADWEVMVATQLLREALAAPPSDESMPLTDVGVGVADDGSIVAVGSPPVPPVEGPMEGVGVADDGSVVAVGSPPVPPVENSVEGSMEGVGVADDGSVVAVGLPPVPPAVGP